MRLLKLAHAEPDKARCVGGGVSFFPVVGNGVTGMIKIARITMIIGIARKFEEKNWLKG